MYQLRKVSVCQKSSIRDISFALGHYRFGFENCTVSQETYKNNEEVIIIKYSDGTLSGALRKYPTLEETVRDWKYVMIQNGEEEEQVQIAIDKIKPFFE